MECALDMFAQGESGWAGDLAFALESLPHPVTLPSADEIRTEGAVDALISRVERSLRDQLLEDIATSEAVPNGGQTRAAAPRTPEEDRQAI